MGPRDERVCVLGLGYIGLPTACLLGTKGFRVRGVDVRPDVIEALGNGETRIREPDLDVLVRSAVNSGRMQAALEPAQADVFIIAVPTPAGEGHRPDTSCISSATDEIAPQVAARCGMHKPLGRYCHPANVLPAAPLERLSFRQRGGRGRNPKTCRKASMLNSGTSRR